MLDRRRPRSRRLRRRPPTPPLPAVLLPRRRRLVRAAARLDQRLLHALRTSPHDPVSERAAQLLGIAGEHGALWAAIGLAGAARDRRRRPRWLVASVLGPLSIYANYAVKVAIGRQRPLIDDHPPLARAPSKLSFPSAHATSSLAGALALGRVNPAARTPLLLLAAAICVGRPYLGMHYPSDVLAGIALGTAIGRLCPLPPEPEGPAEPDGPAPPEGPPEPRHPRTRSGEGPTE